MLDDNSKLFTNFKQTHDNYSQNKTEWKDKYNEEGTKILRIIRRYEDSLCSRSENSGFGKFSSNLSEKFWEEIRAQFPLIDEIQIT